MSLYAAFGPVVASMLQAGFLEREMREGLDSNLAYRRLASQETFPGRIGESMTRTRKGRLAPVTTPLTPSVVNGDIENGVSVSGGITRATWSTEQYLATLSEYAATQDLNIMQEQTTIADMFIANARNNGVQAAQSMERICRKKLFDAYLGGNTRLLAAPSGSLVTTPTAVTGATVTDATATVHVDDIRGFLKLIVGGALTDVSATNYISGIVTTAAGAKFTVRVETAVPYGSTDEGRSGSGAGGANTYVSGKTSLDLTITPSGIPGKLTVTNKSAATWTPAAGDTLIADQAPLILRPNNKLNHAVLTAADTFTMSILEDAVAYLRDNGVPPMEDGNYLVICDNTSMRQLFGDPDFKLLYQGNKTNTPEYGNQSIVQLLGMTIIPTTETYIQTQPAIATTGPRIRRPIVCGADCIVQCNFEGMESWIKDRGIDVDDTVVMIDGVVQIVREPLDRLKQMVAMSWTWIGDYAVPSDMTATSAIIPTASGSMFKRCVVIEHAG